MTGNFRDRLARRIDQIDSILCVGLDPDPSRLPPGSDIVDFLLSVIAQTEPFAAAYKINFAFFESRGVKGWEQLEQICSAIPDQVPTIGDAKRGDIGNTSRAYAASVFDHLGLDSVTLSPYMGRDSVQPFLDYEDRGIFILCRTSNAGAADLQNLDVAGMPLWQKVADLVGSWDDHGNAGLVVGATAPAELQQVRRRVGDDMTLLIPGVGAQGGDAATSAQLGCNSTGGAAVVNVSRGVLYAEDPVSAATEFRDQLNSGRPRGS